jgi:hypothetical protein
MLALLTIVFGVVWHSPLIAADGRAALQPVFTVVGFPFIAAMRFVNRAIGASPLTPLAGLLLGLLPYVIADAIWRRVRRPATSVADHAADRA